jgi:hypothetical protein
MYVCIRGVGYTGVVEALLPYRNTIKIFLPIFDFKKNISYFEILVNLRRNNAHNENIASLQELKHVIASTPSPSSDFH